MLTQFKMDCRLHKADFLVYLLGELGGFLLGVLLLILIMRTDKEADSWFCLGTMMALVATTILVLFIGGFGYSGEFQLAIVMGRTRGAFMGSYALRLLLQIGVSYLLALRFTGWSWLCIRCSSLPQETKRPSSSSPMPGF